MCQICTDAAVINQKYHHHYIVWLIIKIEVQAKTVPENARGKRST